MMPAKIINLQDSFLNQVRKDNVPVTIHLVNGFQIKGNVKGFDNFTVILDSLGKQQMVYKHAISTITPAHPVSTNFVLEKSERNDASEKEED
jgi:host factor-I protein